MRRSLFSRRSGLIRFTAAVAVTGIAVGVASLIIAQAIGRGFQSALSEGILSRSPHISVFYDDKKAITDHAALIEKIRAVPGVASASGTANAYAVLNTEKGQFPAIVSVDETQTTDPAVARPGIELAAKAGILSGDTAEIFVIKSEGSPRQRKINIGEPFKSGMFEQDSSVVHVSPLLFGVLNGDEAFVPTEIAVSVDDIHSAEETANKIRELIGGELRFVGWQEANAPLFEALSLERKAAAAIILLIVLVAMLNIVTTLSLMVAERRADIAVLRTFGARSRTIIGIFMLEGILLGVLGTTVGAVIGVSACVVINRLGFFQLDREIYAVGEITLMTSPTDVFYIITAALLLSLAAAVYPAFRSTNVKPLESLRNIS